MESRKLPEYVYDENTTLSGLFRRCMAELGLDEAGLAQAIGRGSGNLPDWLADKETNALLTSARERVELATGIDIDRWLVCYAKQQALRNYPELAGVVTYERFKRRRDLVDEITEYAAVYANQTASVAWQLGVPRSTCNIWTRDSERAPSGQYLERLIIGLSKGLIIGTRDDVAFIMTCRQMLGFEPQEMFPGAVNFAAAIDLMFRTAGTRSAGEVQTKTGIKRHTVQMLTVYNDQEASRLTPTTITDVVGGLVRLFAADIQQRFNVDDAVAAYLRAREEFDKQGEDKERLEEPAFVTSSVRASVKEVPVQGSKDTEPAPAVHESRSEPQRGVSPVMQPTTPSSPQAPERQLKSEAVAKASLQIFENGAKAFRSLLGLPELATGFAPWVGETLNGLPFCATQTDFRKLPEGSEFPPADVHQLVQVARIMRRLLTACGGLPERERLALAQHLGPELQELFLSFRALGYPQYFPGLELIAETRRFQENFSGGKTK